ncbi:phosphotransferase enzyme family protein [Streptomyces yokosukanensis]|uniref:Phosphotransferase enzyme family protein n=1 Tax=Streptomyces yokosukanensis TaxID=67386 RepID=A0A101PA51_9ACTN|nr:aminoglycoside phosphotransferase family protein [Streptomyces yokosukanensis]KUN07745.1 phosphotransferase enzyme family protein [Streptomyces yokosukanensis]
MGAPPVPRDTAGGRAERALPDAVREAFLAEAARRGRTSGGFHNENYVLALTEPLARLLGRTPGTLVTVRLPRAGVLPVVIRTWGREAEILRAVQGVLPDVPECLVEADGFAVHSYVEGVPLSSVRRTGEPLDAPLIGALADLLARTAQVRSAALPPLPPGWPRNHTDSQGFLRTLARMADLQIREPNWRRFGGLFTALGVPEDALVRLAERIPAMSRRPYGLLHADLHRDNVIVSYGGASPLVRIDWELATYGDPLHDLAVHLVRMRYPDHQWDEVVAAWAGAMGAVRPAAVNGVGRDLRHYVAFERAQSVYPDVMRAATSLEDSFDQRRLDEATAWVHRAVTAAAEPLGLGRVPGREEIERILFRWRASMGHGAGPCAGAAAPAGAGPPPGPCAPAIDWQPDRRVPEHPDFPHSAVADALVLEGAAPAHRVFKGTAHLNSVLRVPGIPFPVVVRRKVAHVTRRERSFLSEHGVLRAIERSGAAVGAPRVLALGESHSKDLSGIRTYSGDLFAIHTYEGPPDVRRRPEHPVNGLLPHEADRLVDQLDALTGVDCTLVDPLAGRPGFYAWLCEQLVALVAALPKESQQSARLLGLPDAPRLREILARHEVTDRAPALLHGDLNPWNLVRREDHLALTLIDWELAVVGDPLYELVRHMHLTPTRPEIRDRMFRRWESRLPARFTENWQRDWRVYRWIEIVRSAYVDLDRLVTGASLDAPNVRRAVESYAMTLAAATASLGLSSRHRSDPQLTHALVRPTRPGGAA